MDLPIIVTTNAKMFQSAFIAVRSICSNVEFKSVIHMSLMAGLMMTVIAYVKGKDILQFAKWLGLYIFVTIGLLGSTATCWIGSTTEPSIPLQKVDHVPIGMAFPAYLFTQIGTGLTQLFEEKFAQPNDPAYSKTGMLFASNLFRQSLGSSFTDPTIQRLMNRFVARCVIGDINISHKYSYDELKNSKDIWKLIRGSTSYIRGFYYYDGAKNKFLTCRKAQATIDTVVTSFVSSNGDDGIFPSLRNKMNTVTSMENRDIRVDLQNAAGIFLKTAPTAADLVKQNFMINSIRGGVKTMASDTNNTAAMQSMSNTISMLKQRMTWSTSYHIGTYDLPIMQTVLLLLAFCSFPLVCILSLLPNLSYNIFKNFIYGIIWLETWPLFYSILNFAITTYAGSTKYVDMPTLSNINQIAQEHSDIAGMAGYLILAIPFLSTFLVKGMASVFAQTAQYLGSVAHGSASTAAAMAVTGNYSFGNVSMANASMNNQSFDNINAHKHDTNFTDMHGMNSSQLANGSVETMTEAGGHIFNTTGGMSSIGVLISASKSVAHQMQTQASQSLSHAATEVANFDQSRSHQIMDGNDLSSNESFRQERNLNTIKSISEDYVKRHGGTVHDAFTRLQKQSASIGERIDASAGLDILGTGAKTLVDEGGSFTGTSDSSHTGSYDASNSESVSSNKLKQFSDALAETKSYAKSHKLNDNMSNAEKESFSIGSNLNKSESLSHMSSDISNNSKSFSANHVQDFVNHTESMLGAEKASDVMASTSGSLYEEKAELAQSYIMDTYNTGHINSNEKSYQIENYASSSRQNIQSQSSGLGVNSKAIDSAREINASASSINQKIKSPKGHDKAKADDEIEKTKEYAQQDLTRHDYDAVKDLL